MMIVPVPITRKVPTCAHCGQPLRQDPPMNGREFLLTIAVNVGVAVAVLATGVFVIDCIFEWVIGQQTLVEVIAANGRDVWALLRRIW